MNTIDVDAFMKRVDESTSANQLADLQLELQEICSSLPADQVKSFTQAYAARLKARSKSISERITKLENDKVDA